MHAPGLELVRGENALNRGCGDGNDHAIGDQLPGEVIAKPCGKTAPPVVRPLAGYLDRVRRHLRGKKRGAVRNGARRGVRRNRKPENVRPICTPADG